MWANGVMLFLSKKKEKVPQLLVVFDGANKLNGERAMEPVSIRPQLDTNWTILRSLASPIESQQTLLHTRTHRVSLSLSLSLTHSLGRERERERIHTKLSVWNSNRSGDH